MRIFDISGLLSWVKIGRGLTKPMLTGFLVICGLLAGGLYSLALTPPTSWTSYTASNNVSNSFLTVQPAVDEYFAYESLTLAPTGSSQCNRYHQAGTNSPYLDARVLDGRFIFDCTWNGQGLRKTSTVLTAACTQSSTDIHCKLPYLAANEKNAGQPGSEGKCAVGITMCGNPINIGTGNKFQAETDFEIPGSPWLSFKRYYNSQPSHGHGTMGDRWGHSFDYRVTARRDGTYAVERPDGSVRVFAGNVNHDHDADVLGTFNVLQSPTGTLTGYSYDNDNGQVETYDTYGRVTRIDFKTGGFINFEHANSSVPLTRAVDHFGRALTFVYTNWRLTSVTTPSGAVYSYTYDTNGRLASRVAPGSVSRTFAYDTSGSNPTILRGLLSQVKDETATLVGNYTYDSSGRAITTEGASGVNRFTVSYSGASNTVTLPLLGTRVIPFADALGTPKAAAVTTTCTGCVAPASTASTYDTSGNPTSFTEETGYKTCVEYASGGRNLPTKFVEFVASTADCATVLASPPTTSPARTTSIEWENNWRVPFRVVDPRSLTTFTYDTSGRLTGKSTVATAGNGTGSEGFAAPTTGLAQTVAFTYNTVGQVLTVDGPRTDANDTTAYAYDASGNLLTVTNPAGQVTTFSNYDAEGRARQITLPNGAVVALGFDARGRLTSQTVAGEATTLTYNTRGLLATRTEPSGRVLTYGYDAAHRLTSVTDQRGAKQQLTLNLAGSPTQVAVQAAGGAVVTQLNQTYDALNRVLTRTGAHVVSPLDGLLTP